MPAVISPQPLTLSQEDLERLKATALKGQKVLNFFDFSKNKPFKLDTSGSYLRNLKNFKEEYSEYLENPKSFDSVRLQNLLTKEKENASFLRNEDARVKYFEEVIIPEYEKRSTWVEGENYKSVREKQKTISADYNPDSNGIWALRIRQLPFKKSAEGRLIDKAESHMRKKGIIAFTTLIMQAYRKRKMGIREYVVMEGFIKKWNAESDHKNLQLVLTGGKLGEFGFVMKNSKDRLSEDQQKEITEEYNNYLIMQGNDLPKHLRGAKIILHSQGSSIRFDKPVSPASVKPDLPDSPIQNPSGNPAP